MSAVMKDQDPSQETTQELAVLKPTSLAEILVISDESPTDFFSNPAYDEQLDKAVAQTTGLVYSADDEGEKLMKADATNINKFATTCKKHALATYKLQTDEIQQLRAVKDGKVKLLLDNRQSMIAQFTELREAKLSLIRTKLTECLAGFWEAGVKEEFRTGSIEPMVIYSSLTPKENLTANAIKFCKDISDGNFAQQTKIESRHLILENRCLKEGINPPLTKVHFGTVFYADDEFFNAKLEELVASEIQRVAEMKAKIERDNEAANQKKIDDALKDQEAELKRQAQAEKDQEAKAEPEKQQTLHQQVDDAIALNRKLEDDRKNPPVVRASTGRMKKPSGTPEGTRTVLVTMVFEWDGVTENTSNQGMEGFLTRKLPEPMQARLKEVSSRDA